MAPSSCSSPTPQSAAVAVFNFALGLGSVSKATLSKSHVLLKFDLNFLEIGGTGDCFLSGGAHPETGPSTWDLCVGVNFESKKLTRMRVPVHP
ncbi:unnamed protein product [Allacma fusca]|uniref:Uncharacterized protein n=1 Tax=Allacma fusca TaxID=39272 RepID=A0A8J2J6R0_9HEXA|nr:unnamed protein product [Allacma fusca]